MSEAATSVTARMQAALDALGGGDAEARNELFSWVAERLHRLAHQTLRRSYPRVARWELTDDVLQGVLLRLWKSLDSCRLQTPLDFLKLASQHLRWELIDLARHHYGPEGAGANHASRGERDDSQPATCEQADHSHEPSALAEWTEFHRKV